MIYVAIFKDFFRAFSKIIAYINDLDDCFYVNFINTVYGTLCLVEDELEILCMSTFKMDLQNV